MQGLVKHPFQPELDDELRRIDGEIPIPQESVVDVVERVMSAELRTASQRPEEFFFERLLSDDVVRAVDDLAPDFKLVVLLADVNGFSYGQIAEILGIPVGTVMSRLHRGRRSLRISLYDYAVAEGYLKTEGEDGEVDPEAPADLGAFRRKKLSGEGR